MKHVAHSLHSADGKALTKTFTPVPGGRAEKESFMAGTRLNSATHDFETIEDFAAVIYTVGQMGGCLLKGALDRKLTDESRAGHTNADGTTTWLMLDLDGLSGFDGSDGVEQTESVLADLGLGDVDHVTQLSASYGVEGDTSLRSHVFMLLEGEVPHARLKDFLKHIGLESKRIHAQTTVGEKSGVLKWLLDPTVAQADKLLYVAPPILNGVECCVTPEERVFVVRRALRAVPMQLIENTPKGESIERRVKRLQEKLCEERGIKPPKTSKRRVGDEVVDVLVRPNVRTITDGPVDDGDRVRLNLDGGKNWSYWHWKDEPKWLYSFKEEPRALISEVLPEYWRALNPELDAVVQAGRPDLTSWENQNDSAAARWFAQAVKDQARYVHETEKWSVWNGNHWSGGSSGPLRLTELARDVAERWLAGAAAVGSEDFENFARRQNSADKLRNMVNLAKSDPALITSASEFDQPKHARLLCCANGTIELETGTLRDSRREEMLSRAAPFEFDPSVDQSAWVGIMKRICGDDIELIEYLQRLAGYCLTGDCSLHQFFILQGDGSNGKSTYVKAIMSVLGADVLAKPADPDEIMVKKSKAGAADPVMAGLWGMRAVICSETRENDVLDEATVKKLTSTNPINPRGLYKAPITFTPTYTVMMDTNHLPKLRGSDNGIKRRIRVVRFTHKFVATDQEKLEFESVTFPALLPGAFAWMVEGAAKYLRSGLAEPESVRVATANYFREEDVFEQWLGQCCEFGPGLEERALRLFENFNAWLVERRLCEWGLNTFTKRMKKLEGVTWKEKHGAARVATYFGVGLDQLAVKARMLSTVTARVDAGRKSVSAAG